MAVMRVALPAWILLVFQALLPAQPQPGAAAHLGKAVRLMEDRLFGEAAAEFEQALAADPNNDEARIYFATCLFAQERNEESRRQFEIERKRKGDLPGLMYYLGQLDLRADDTVSAIKKLAPLETNPAFPKASFYLGLAYLAAGQQARAMECLERAAKNNPRDPETHYRLARVYSVAGRDDDANREYKLYRDWREKQQIAQQVGTECAEALRTKPIAQARAVCQRIAGPDNPQGLIFLGRLYCDNGAFAEAVEPLRRATELAPQSFEAWQFLGLSLFRLGRYQEALPPLRKAADLNPRLFDSLALLASALHALGDDAAALPILERARALKPDDPQVAAAIEQLRAAKIKK